MSCLVYQVKYLNCFVPVWNKANRRLSVLETLCDVLPLLSGVPQSSIRSPLDFSNVYTPSSDDIRMTLSCLFGYRNTDDSGKFVK